MLTCHVHDIAYFWQARTTSCKQHALSPACVSFFILCTTKNVHSCAMNYDLFFIFVFDCWCVVDESFFVEIFSLISAYCCITEHNNQPTKPHQLPTNTTYQTTNPNVNMNQSTNPHARELIDNGVLQYSALLLLCVNMNQSTSPQTTLTGFYCLQRYIASFYILLLCMNMNQLTDQHWLHYLQRIW